jgi:hypothetical protein
MDNHSSSNRLNLWQALRELVKTDHGRYGLELHCVKNYNENAVAQLALPKINA